MVVPIHIGFRYCEKKSISIIVDYTIKARQLNPITVIYEVNVKLFDGGKTKNHWCVRFLVLFSNTCSTSGYDFLEKFILRILLTDFVLSFIGAFELIMFQNKMDQLVFPKPQQTAVDMLRYFMIRLRILA